MKEYIEKAALKERFQKRLIWLKKDVHDEYSKGLYHGCETDMGLIDEILAADVVEVRHGRWLTTDAYPHHLYCSVCYKTYAKNAKWVNELDLPTNYCPNCGARMDKEDEHEAD